MWMRDRGNSQLVQSDDGSSHSAVDVSVGSRSSTQHSKDAESLHSDERSSHDLEAAASQCSSQHSGGQNDSSHSKSLYENDDLSRGSASPHSLAAASIDSRGSSRHSETNTSLHSDRSRDTNDASVRSFSSRPYGACPIPLGYGQAVHSDDGSSHSAVDVSVGSRSSSQHSKDAESLHSDERSSHDLEAAASQCSSQHSWDKNESCPLSTSPSPRH